MTDFDKLIERRGTDSTKWSRYAGDVIPMWVADMDFPAPPAVVDALRARVDHGVFGYSAPQDRLTTRVQEWLLEKFNWEVHKEWIVWVPGVVPGINITCHALGSRRKAVTLCVPVYYPFRNAPAFAGRSATEVPLVREGRRWVFDFDALAVALRGDHGVASDLFLLCNPFNPVGRALTRDELLKLAEVCAAADVVICSDEIHAELLLDQVRHLPIASLDEEIADRTITLMSCSKAYNLAGLGGCAFAVISNPELRQAFDAQRKSDLIGNINSFALVAMQAALEGGSGWLDELLSYLRGNRDLVQSTLASLPGLQMTHVEATYLAWLDVRQLGLPDPHRHFLRAGLDLSDGKDFGSPGFLRLNFGCPRSLLREGLRRLGAALPG